MKTHTWQRLLYSMAGLVVIAGVTYACKDFLNQPSQGTLDQNTLTTKVGVEGSLIAAYRALDCDASSAGSWGCAASNWVWGSVGSGDAYKGSNLGDQQPINDIETFLYNVGEADGYINQKWAQAYEGVSRANATLRLLEAVVAAKPGEIDTTTAKEIKGEALFLRAHYHFEAFRMWGHIPYYFETDTDLRKANDAPLDSIVKLIITDLETAETLLHPLGASPRNGEKGRATEWTARAYKGRVQVYAADLVSPTYWAAAKATLDSVVNTGPYALETSFDRVWTANPAYRNGTETILAFQASTRDGEPSGWNANWGERLNFPHSGSHFGCCGFHQAAFNLVNFFQVDAAGLPLALSDTNWNNPPLDPSIPISDTASANLWKGQNFRAGVMRPVDPRIDWTLGRDSVPYKDWGLHNRGWIRDASYSGPYSPKKNIHEQAITAAESNVGWQATQLNDVPIHLFRYADLLLMLAEAETEVGSLSRAADLVDSVRARAGKMAQGCGLPGAAIDTMVVKRFPACGTNPAIQPMAIPLVAASATLDTLVTPWAYYKVGLYPSPFPSQAYARQAIHYERRLELAMEGQRFFDVRRWGGSDTTVARYVNKEKTRIPYLSLAAPYQLPQYLYYPIPSVQIELSKVGTECRLVQNTGWGQCN